jgi:uncharacterized protein (TIGR03000 family)
MRKLPLVLVTFLSLSAVVFGYGRGGYRPPVYHVPAFRPAPVYRPPAYHPAPVYRPPVYHPAPVYRPAPLVQPRLVQPSLVRPGGVTGGSSGQVHLPSDLGLGHIAGRIPASRGHFTYAVPPALLASRGATVRRGFYYHDAFRHDWWRNHRGIWGVPGFWLPAQLWIWPSWPVLTGWFGWGGVPPIYYDYGTTIIYQGDQVYDGAGQVVASAPDYYQQAYTLAQSAPAADAKEDVWQSLGIFALVQSAVENSAMMFQLAVNKSGTIRGNYYNALTDTALPVSGAVDKKTQRAAWTVGGNKNTVYETGVANLTRDETPLLIHIGKNHTEQWLLVRLREQGENTSTGNAPAPTASTGTDTARLEITLPADAELWFNSVPTGQTGPTRTFVTPPLKIDDRFYYDLRARWTEDGELIDRTRRVYVHPGAIVRVDFHNPNP